MADQETKPPAKVMSTLDALYGATLTAGEQIRRQKVRFKVRYRWCRLVDELAHMLHCYCCPCKHKHPDHHERDKHKCGHCVLCWQIATLHRIEYLGGEAESAIGKVDVSDDVKTAIETIVASLQTVYDMAQDVIDAAKNDKPTAKVSSEIQCAVDHHLECAKAHLRQIGDMGVNYLITLA